MPAASASVSHLYKLPLLVALVVLCLLEVLLVVVLLFLLLVVRDLALCLFQSLFVLHLLATRQSQVSIAPTPTAHQQRRGYLRKVVNAVVGALP